MEKHIKKCLLVSWQPQPFTLQVIRIIMILYGFVVPGHDLFYLFLLN